MNSTPELPNPLPDSQNYIESTVAKLKASLQSEKDVVPEEWEQQFCITLDLMSELLQLGYSKQNLRQLLQEVESG